MPYYALYVQQPDSHSAIGTMCRYCRSAADLAIVLAPAHGDTKRRLPRRPVDAVLAAGRPFRCLGGCQCVKAPPSATPWQALEAFLRQDFPSCRGANPQTPLPAKTMHVTVNSGAFKPGSQPPAAQTRRDASKAPKQDSVLLVRLGRPSPSADPGRRAIGTTPTCRRTRSASQRDGTGDSTCNAPNEFGT